MARRFIIKVPRIKFVNKCILCGRIIPEGYSICSSCARKGR